MQVGAVCQRLVFTIRRSEPVSQAAQLMRENHVGYLVVVELEPFARPVGVLTDHDIVVEVVAREMDPRTVCVADIMTANPTTARESDPLEAAFQKMAELGLRRVPVVNDSREVAGVLVMDDLCKAMVNAAQQVVNAIRSERQRESVRRAEEYVALRQAAAQGPTRRAADSTEVAAKPAARSLHAVPAPRNDAAGEMQS